MACQGGVGSTNPDIAGLGIIIAFAAQAGVSLIFSVWAWYLQAKTGTKTGHREYILTEKKKIVQKVLSSVSDIQIMNGIGLLIAALTQVKSLDLYHFHIVFDTVNFTSVSFCAALVNLLESEKGGRTTRLVAIGVFSALYLAFTITFGITLNKWDSNVTGSCYITRGISAPTAEHPYVDKVYLIVTSIFVFFVIYVALSPLLDMKFAHSYLSESPSTALILGPLRIFWDDTYWDELNQSKQEAAIMLPLLFQYPLHLYFIITLRRWNADLLVGDSEDTWGFGQIVALVLLAPTILECGKAIRDYRKLGSERGEDIERGYKDADTQTEGIMKDM